MTRHAELKADSPKPEARKLQPRERGAPTFGLRTLTSVELLEPRHSRAVPAKSTVGPAPAKPGAPGRRRRPPAEGLSPGHNPLARDMAQGDAALPFRLPPHCVWTVVDTYQVDGAQYVVVRRDQVPRCAPRALSCRESQALKLAAHGHTNKAIAFEMGASASTVGVFLYRAARKLGSRTRAELLACFLGQPANEVSPGGGGCGRP
jgi:DNA-binding CsgD family transcriptional regulator